MIKIPDIGEPKLPAMRLVILNKPASIASSSAKANPIVSSPINSAEVKNMFFRPDISLRVLKYITNRHKLYLVTYLRLLPKRYQYEEEEDSVSSSHILA